MAVIEVKIKDGKIAIEVSGVEDASCAELTKTLQEQLGTTTDVQEKPEYFVELEDMQLYAQESE